MLIKPSHRKLVNPNSAGKEENFRPNTVDKLE
jgi:hypothetical protein